MSDPVVDTQFVSGTVITSDWLNGVNDFVNTDGATKVYADNVGTVLRADLASTSDAAKGDALLGVNLAVTGSVGRTQHQKNNDYVSVKDFGAVGDGVTNDSAAVQAAIDWVFTQSTGHDVYVPSGTYLLNTKITIPKDTTRSFKFFGAGQSTVFKGGASFSGELFDVGSGVAAGGVEYEMRDFMIGAPVSGTCTGIKLRNCNTMRLHGIKMQLVTLGIHLDACFAIRITECLFDVVTTNAIFSDTSSHNLIIDGCRFYSVGGTTFQTIQINTTTDNIVINGCDFEQCFGVYGMTSPTALRLTGNYIEFCGGTEFNHIGSATGWECHGNWIALNTTGGTTWNNISGGSFCGNTLADMNVLWGGGAVDVDVGINTIKGTATLAPTNFTNVTVFSNGYTAGLRQVSYSRSFDGRLTLRGNMNSGTLGATAFTLPVGYRPVQQEWFCTVGGGNALAVVLVDTNGNVVPQTAPATNVSLDGISFICKTTV